jgi:hypothetical protein
MVPALHDVATRHNPGVRQLVLAAFVAASLSGCTVGDGEGPRYTGPVTSVSSTQVCVRASESANKIVCGSVPNDAGELPRVGQCVSLFAHFSDSGRKKTWTATSLHLDVPDKKCSTK